MTIFELMKFDGEMNDMRNRVAQICISLEGERDKNGAKQALAIDELTRWLSSIDHEFGWINTSIHELLCVMDDEEQAGEIEGA